MKVYSFRVCIFFILCAMFCTAQIFTHLRRNPFIKCRKNYQRDVVASACMCEGKKMLFVQVDGKIRCIKNNEEQK